MACVYLHKTSDGTIFYVGIGNSIKRAYIKHGRNKFWNNVVKKYKDYTIEILCDKISREEASSLETHLINLYGRRILGTGTLVNLSDGDIGSIGYKHSKEARIKISRNNAKTKSKRVIDTSTNTIYSCLKDCCLKLNLSYSGTRAKLNGQNPNNTNLKYIQ